MRINNKFTGASFLLALSLIFIGSVKAEDNKSFSISPPNFDISANPGDTVKNTIKIENLSDAKITLTTKGENFVAYGDGGQVNLTEEDSTYSINKWLNFNAAPFSIEAHKSYLFEYSIVVPKNAEPGSHYGAVVFANSPVTSQDSSQATVVQEIGALVLIRIPGEVNEDAKLNSFSAESQYFTDPKIKLNALVENTGGVHFKMTANINIYDVFGNKVKTIEVPSHNILPGSKRLFTSESEFDGFGFYKANIEMYYANGTKVLKSETTFTSLYLQRSIPITLGAAAVISIYVIFRKRINKAIKIIVKG
jgi:hypothetical protein